MNPITSSNECKLHDTPELTVPAIPQELEPVIPDEIVPEIPQEIVPTIPQKTIPQTVAIYFCYLNTKIPHRK